MVGGVKVSIVVPVLDEQERIAGLLDHLAAHFPSCEVVVADGGSTDRTVELATGRSTVVRAPRGRGPQGEAGAAAATGDVLWFVHADTRPDPGALDAMTAALADPQVVAGGFTLRFDHAGPVLRWLAWTSNRRARHLGWVFGDQAMFVRRGAFDAVGGFGGLVLMEDLEIARRLRDRGRVRLLDPPCTASARRFTEHGTVRMIARMQWCKALYFAGVSPADIHRRYTASRRPLRERAAALRARLRPVDPAFAAALARRWAELPPGARTPGQVLGRHAVGCEGTHGVFPRCNLSCTPCYHSRDANRVRVDGPHTLARVEEQMALLERLRGPAAHAQLIGGEVTLLDPDDHAAALAIMRRHGREPMSMTHGDVDADHLERLALGPDGRRRFRRLSFAVHVDSLMSGRRGIPRASDERALTPYRRRFVEAVGSLRRHGVRTFVAHNMTVTPANLGQVADVVRDCLPLEIGMLSFQPAAFLGDHRRWHEDYRDADADSVWAEIERGAGARLDPTLFQHGDVRCNRVAYGFRLGDRWFPLLDGDDPRDLAVRDAFFRTFGAVTFSGVPPLLLAVRLARVIAGQPAVLAVAGRWLGRTVRRVGPGRVLRHRPRPLSFVMHSFMDAADVAPAWELSERGEIADDPTVRATQERLAACHYAMAHPDGPLAGRLVPACVQHSGARPRREPRAAPAAADRRDPRVTDPAPGDPPAAASRAIRVLRSPWPRLALFVLLLGGAGVLAVTRGTSLVTDVRTGIDALGPVGAIVFVVVYAAASMALLPVSLLSAVAGVLFGPLLGVGVVWVGAMLGAAGSFAVGRTLSRPAVEALAGERLERLDRFLARRAFLAVLIVRLVPLFGFVLVNYGAAATAIGWRPYLAGTALGIVPGVLALVTIGGTAGDPTSPAFLAAVGGFVLLAVGGGLVARRMRS